MKMRFKNGQAFEVSYIMQV